MQKPVIGIIIGSQSDLEQIKPCFEIFDEFKVTYELKILSAHRSPKRLISYIQDVAGRRIKIFIAAAGGAAALAGTVAAHTTLPVIAIPIKTSNLNGLDSLLSTVQMPGGVPVACMAIGKSGARNAAIFSLQILALSDKKIANRLFIYKKKLSRVVKTK